MMTTTEMAERIAAADWHNIPAGYYAIPVYDFDSWDGTGDPDVLAYRTFRRTAARTTKTGRTIGRNRFIIGATLHAPSADPDEVRLQLAAYRAADIDVLGPCGDVIAAVQDILRDLGKEDAYRANYGKFTGRCGCCHRHLTDPTSKLYGIGPECRGSRTR
jgi:Family of unknown function (DUF6011)